MGDIKTEWDLGLLFKGDDDPRIIESRKRIEAEVDNFVKKWRPRKDYLENLKPLKEALEEYEKLEMVGGGEGTDGGVGNEYFYFWLKSQKDLNDSNIKACLGKASDFIIKMSNELVFFTIALGKIEEKNQKKFLESSELKKYKHYLERTFASSKYILSEAEEKIMTLKSEPAYSLWVRMLNGFLAKEERDVLDVDGKLRKKSFSEILSLMSEQNKEVRDSAASAFNDILNKHKEVAESEINAVLKDKQIDDGLRKFERPDAARHLSDDLESEIVDSLINTVSSEFGLAREFYKLKAKLLGMEKLEYHERNVDYGEIDLKYSFEKAFSLVYDVLNELDKEFGEIYLRMFKQGQVDVFPKKGKKSGAFCTDSLFSQPTFVMLNHTDKLRDVTIIAHEFGHAINGELARKQSPLNYGMVLSTAEVASTFMEDFVFRRLVNGVDDETKLALIMMKLNDELSTIFRQTACYKFEQELHREFREKGYLPLEDIGRIFSKHMASYMGEAVKMSPGNENWWVYWGHIRTFFYVYSYSSGILISKAMQRKVREDPGFILDVKEFLSLGLTASPKKVFANMGINISEKVFWESGIAEFKEWLKEAENLARKLGKIK